MLINSIILNMLIWYISFAAYENGVPFTNVRKDIDTGLILEEFRLLRDVRNNGKI